MVKIPSKVSERIVAGIKRFQPILASAKSRDVGESDTVTIVKDILAEVFGYEKYSEITSEFAIRGTYCDLATKIDGVLQLLIEVKAIGLELKEAHVKQAVDYAANQGVDWVVLTNGICWRIYKVLFSKPIDQQLVVEIDFIALNPKSAKDIESVYLVCKEGWLKSVLGDYHTQKQALSRFFLGALVLSEPTLQVLRRELKRLSPDVRVETDEIRQVLLAEVLKREVTEGDQAKEAARKIARVAGKVLRAKQSKAESSETDGGDASTDDDPASDTSNPESSDSAPV
jgi:predicted type IV restriction endonuclease